MRVEIKDTIRASAYGDDGKLISNLYKSGFTGIKQIMEELIRKVPYYSGKRLRFVIQNDDSKEVSIKFKNVNNNGKNNT